ncbi:sca1 complex scaffold protein scaa [Anaeramoeba ignava]|uniref:Sca1 complex scaffold protein scaa n=1 Tax=Anaeramoeba ignava TaxID=1746090 RepID=A0A9Q0R9E8_ANAIG|nr:sca1 complex scaffold protein scaa [Anaeramoeba ignava]
MMSKKTTRLSFADKAIARNTSNTKLLKDGKIGQPIYLPNTTRLKRKISKQIPEIIHSKKEKIPVYFDRKGFIYDIHYRSIKEEDFEKEKQNQYENQNQKTQVLLEYAPQKLKDFPPFPKIDDYQSFSDYEQAILDWKSSVELSLGFIIPPIILGRTFNRPQVIETESEKFDLHYRESTERTSSSSEAKSVDYRKSSNIDMKIIAQESEELEKKGFQMSDTYSPRNTISRLKQGDKLPEYMPDTQELMGDISLWDSQLIPPTPNPSHYLSFKEFELAYKRWEKLTLSTLDTLPPHCSSFVNMYGLITAEEKEEKERKRRAEEKARLFKEQIQTKKKKTRTFDTAFLNWKMNLVGRLSRYSINKKNQGYENMLLNFPYEALKSLKESFENKEENLSDKKETLEDKEEIAKETEPTLVMNLDLSREETEKSALLARQKYEGLWSTADQDTQQSLTKFIIQISEKISENLKTFSQSITPVLGRVHGQLEQEWFSDSNSQFNAPFKGNNENNSSDFNIALRRVDIPKKLLDNSKDVPEEINGMKVKFNVPQYDVYHKIDLYKLKKSEKYREDLLLEINRLSYITFHNSIQSWFNPKQIEKWNLSERKKNLDKEVFDPEKFGFQQIHTVLHSDIPHDIFSHILSDYTIQDNKEKSYSEAFLFPFNENNFYEILSIFNNSHSHLVFAKLSQLVMEALQGNISKQLLEKYIYEQDVQNFYFLSFAMCFFQDIHIPIFPFISEMRNASSLLFKDEFKSLEYSVFLHYYFRNKNQEFKNIIWNEDNVLNDILKSKEVNLLGQIRLMAVSKFQHVRFGCRNIWKTMLSIPTWMNFLVDRYTTNLEMLIYDLSPPQQPDNMNPDDMENMSVPLMVELVHDFLIQAFSSANESHPILMESLFFQLVKHLQFYIKKLRNPTLSFIANILHRMSQAFSKFSLIESRSKEVKVSFAVTTKKRKLYIEYSNIETILQMVSDSAVMLYPLKTSLIRLIIELIRPDSVFSDVCQNPEFFTKIHIIFRSSHDHEFSKALWDLFTESLMFHSGVFELLKRTKHLKSMIELISSSSDPATTITGLRALNSIFCLPEKEARRIAKGKPSLRPLEKDPMKSIQKDVRFFADFFAKNSLFVRIHMIYMNCEKKQGRLFAVKCLKKESYRAGIMKIHDMSNGMNEQPIKSKLIVKMKTKEKKKKNSNKND